MNRSNRLILENFGPIRHADMQLADLTVSVGPQATGKSLLWQMLKWVLDAPLIAQELQRFGIDWDRELSGFLELYFGEGMQSLIGDQSGGSWQGGELDFAALARPRKPRNGHQESMFYIPAQRVMALRDGLTRPFTDYRSGDPYVIRSFSERLHNLVQSEFARTSRLFPQPKRLSETERRLINESFFHGFRLELSREKFQKKLILKRDEIELPFLAWSAGQREFTPLLLGLYWLMPAGNVSRRNDVQWVVIEEPEMGLHPKAIFTFMLLVLELMRRGYRVCVSTHSPQVLDVVWGLQALKAHGGGPDDLLAMFELKKSDKTRQIAAAALGKDYSVNYFGEDGIITDISSLDPGATDPATAGWGGLSAFSGRVGDVVADVVARAEGWA